MEPQGGNVLVCMEKFFLFLNCTLIENCGYHYLYFYYLQW